MEFNILATAILLIAIVLVHLSNAADRGDEAVNLIGDIMVKMS